jgi:cytochrome o ubiquinol oxidase subunit 2
VGIDQQRARPGSLRRTRLVTAARRAARFAPLVLLAGCSGGVIDPQGPVGAAEWTITLDAIVIMLGIVIPTILVAYFFAWRYRASNERAQYRPDWAYSGRLELIVWAIPLLVIMFLGGMIWVGSHQLDPARPLPAPPGVQPEEIQVVSLDWKWLFIYPREGVASVNEAVVPAGVPVRFRITSASVMNTFFVPQLGGMIYAMNGMETDMWLQADRPGAYAGRSGQFSGDGFADMHFMVRSVPPAQFAAWAAQTRGAGRTLDAAEYQRLAQQSSKIAPYTYGAVQPDLFMAVIKHVLPPGPGPTDMRDRNPPDRS